MINFKPMHKTPSKRVARKRHFFTMFLMKMTMGVREKGQPYCHPSPPLPPKKRNSRQNDEWKKNASSCRPKFSSSFWVWKFETFYVGNSFILFYFFSFSIRGSSPFCRRQRKDYKSNFDLYRRDQIETAVKWADLSAFGEGRRRFQAAVTTDGQGAILIPRRHARTHAQRNNQEKNPNHPGERVHKSTESRWKRVVKKKINSSRL